MNEMKMWTTEDPWRMESLMKHIDPAGLWTNRNACRQKAKVWQWSTHYFHI